MDIINWRDFQGDAAWDALDIAQIEGATIRVHWTDKPYIWHCNDGEEVFVVLSGAVRMYMRDNSGETVIEMQSGDIFHAKLGDEHKAEPIGAAHILVIEKKGSQ